MKRVPDLRFMFPDGLWLRDRGFAGLPGWPASNRRAREKAKRDGLPRRPASGRGGGHEYDARGLDAETLASLVIHRLLAKVATPSAPAPERPQAAPAVEVPDGADRERFAAEYIADRVAEHLTGKTRPAA